MTITDTVRLEMQNHHDEYHSWRAVGRIIGKSAAYAQRVVRGDLEPSQEVIARWMASRSCVPVKHEQIAYPIDHDAILHLLPQGTGLLHTYTVPDNAEVVIVPAGARIVQPKPESKPPKKRERIEVNRYSERGFTHAEIIEIVREVFDTGNVPSWIWNHPGMADVINTQLTLLRARATRNDPARIMHLVDGWLDEDAGTDPGEAAAVLAKIEQD